MVVAVVATEAVVVAAGAAVVATEVVVVATEASEAVAVVEPWRRCPLGGQMAQAQTGRRVQRKGRWRGPRSSTSVESCRAAIPCPRAQGKAELPTDQLLLVSRPSVLLPVTVNS